MSQQQPKKFVESTMDRSRSTRSASPVMEDIGSPASSSAEETSVVSSLNTPNMITTTVTHTGAGGRVTRSQSVESSGYETTDSRKRKRHAKPTSVPNSNKKKTDPSKMLTSSPPPIYSSSSSVKEDTERETRNSSQRLSKEAREAKKAQRDLAIKERLEELDKLEQAVKDGSHSEYHKLLSNIEQKRANMLHVVEKRRSLAEGIVTNFFNWQKNAAYSQYHWDKLALRRSMIQHVQHKMNILEQEYYSNHVQSLSEEDADQDLEWAKQDPVIEEKNNPDTVRASSPQIPSSQSQKEASPPLDMLAK
ncbi:hypothetical protein CU098_012193 [Rhizopus stolonifer]|uniref:Uncharacterized protein n=1 Tax=Rhizopus stolonifer TaxID=4846 RepID=A0A367KLN4_RHIST|nr:hypothetical protein CU098_012193 [Rhizopus stolonifer]